MPNILTGDDSNFTASIGNWSPGVFGPAFGVTVNRIVPGTPPPSGDGHVGQILTPTVRDAMAGGVTPADIGGSPSLTVPSVYPATPGLTYTFDSDVFMDTPSNIFGGSVQSILQFWDASGAFLGRQSSGFAVLEYGDPWTSLPSLSAVAPGGSAWVGAYVSAEGTGNFLAGDAVLFSTNSLNVPSPPLDPVLIFSDDNGVTWQDASTPFDGHEIYAIAFDGTYTVAIAGADAADGSTTVTLAISTDRGISWTAIPNPADGNIAYGIAFAASLGQWIIIRDVNDTDAADPRVFTSPDLITWTGRATNFDWDNSGGGSFATTAFYVAAHDRTILVAGTNAAGTRGIARTVDMVTWTYPASMTNVGLGKIRFLNGSWFAVGVGASLYRSTDDGVTWVEIAQPLSGLDRCTDITWDGVNYILLAAPSSGSATGLATSPDLVTWTTHSTPLDTASVQLWASAADPAGSVIGSNSHEPATPIVANSTTHGVSWDARTSGLNGKGLFDALALPNIPANVGGGGGTGGGGGGGGVGGGIGGTGNDGNNSNTDPPSGGVGGGGGGGGGGVGGTGLGRRLAFRFGASPANVSTVENAPGYFGVSAGVLVHGLRGSIEELMSDGLVLGPWLNSGRKISFTACCMPNVGVGNVHASYVAAARGDYDYIWRNICTKVRDFGFPDAVLRPLHEFNLSYIGEWGILDFSGNVIVDPTLFISVFRRFVQIAREVSPQFIIDFCWLIGGDVPVVDYWPGADVVDIVGNDTYDRSTWGADPVTRWTVMVGLLNGLQDQLDLATLYGKQMSFPEWGVTFFGPPFESASGGDNPYFVSQMRNWISFYNFNYHTPYFDTQDPVVINSDMLGGDFPNSLAQLRVSFGLGSG